EDEPQVSECIFDFSTLEEPETPVHTIRNARGQQRLFERSRLCVRAIEDRAVAALTAAIHPLANAVDVEVRFVALVERGVELDRLAALPARPEILPEPSAVVADERVCGIENVAGRSVVLLEP